MVFFHSGISRSFGNYPDWNNSTMERIPIIKSAAVIGTMQLLICFDHGEQRVYNCKPLLSRPQFSLLKNTAISRAVRVDTGGYGISWNDDMDLSEYELWTNGKSVVNESF